MNLIYSSELDFRPVFKMSSSSGIIERTWGWGWLCMAGGVSDNCSGCSWRTCSRSGGCGCGGCCCCCCGCAGSWGGCCCCGTYLGLKDVVGISVLQSGQLCWCWSQPLRQFKWNIWPHGSFLPEDIVSLQIKHSPDEASSSGEASSNLLSRLWLSCRYFTKEASLDWNCKKEIQTSLIIFL